MSAAWGDEVKAAEQRVCAAIRNRDADALSRELTDDFVHESLRGETQDRAAFLHGVATLPVTILEIAAEDLRARDLGGCVTLAGVQRVRVRMQDGTEATALTAFVDVFVRHDAGWRIRHAVSVELPSA